METGAGSDRDDWDAERVRALRAYLASSQSDFADRIGTRQQTVSEWETGSSQPRRMSRRLLQMVAEEAGFYEVERRDEPPAPDGGGAPETPGAITSSRDD
jgi:transcriptional regulator with XRE-family HTH domain